MTILAYVDPGLGTLIWQTIVAAFVGLFFYLRKTRQWIVKVCRKFSGRERYSPDMTPRIARQIPAGEKKAATSIE